jgi:hypothetical protein
MVIKDAIAQEICVAVILLAEASHIRLANCVTAGKVNWSWYIRQHKQTVRILLLQATSAITLCHVKVLMVARAPCHSTIRVPPAYNSLSFYLYVINRRYYIYTATLSMLSSCSPLLVMVELLVEVEETDSIKCRRSENKSLIRCSILYLEYVQKKKGEF